MSASDPFEAMRERFAGLPVEIPPACFKDLGANFIDYAEGTSLTISLPLHERYNNPGGLILGGYLSVFFDLAFGALSFLVAGKPTTSLDLDTTFLRPLRAADETVIIQASMVNRGRTYLVMDARATNPRDELVATATSRLQILG